MYLSFLLTSLIIFYVLKRQSNNWINPLNIYILVWIICVSLYNLKLIPYYSTSFDTWFFIISSIIVNWLGYTVLHMLLPKNNNYTSFNENKFPLIVTHKHCARVLMKHLLKMDDDKFEKYDIPSKKILFLINKDRLINLPLQPNKPRCPRDASCSSRFIAWIISLCSKILSLG